MTKAATARTARAALMSARGAADGSRRIVSALDAGELESRAERVAGGDARARRAPSSQGGGANRACSVSRAARRSSASRGALAASRRQRRRGAWRPLGGVTLTPRRCRRRLLRVPASWNHHRVDVAGASPRDCSKIGARPALGRADLAAGRCRRECRAARRRRARSSRSAFQA